MLTVDFVGCANGISGGIKEVEGALRLLPRIGRSHNGCPGVFIAPSSLYGTRIFDMASHSTIDGAMSKAPAHNSFRTCCLSVGMG